MLLENTSKKVYCLDEILNFQMSPKASFTDSHFWPETGTEMNSFPGVLKALALSNCLSSTCLCSYPPWRAVLDTDALVLTYGKIWNAFTFSGHRKEIHHPSCQLSVIISSPRAKLAYFSHWVILEEFGSEACVFGDEGKGRQLWTSGNLMPCNFNYAK